MAADHGLRLVIGRTTAVPQRDDGPLGRRQPVGVRGQAEAMLGQVLVIELAELLGSTQRVRHAHVGLGKGPVNSVVQLELGTGLFS